MADFGVWGRRLPAAVKRRESRRLAWARSCRRELKFEIRMLFTAFEGGQQQLKDTIDGWLDPGRWPAAIKKRESRRVATTDVSEGLSETVF